MLISVLKKEAVNRVDDRSDSQLVTAALGGCVESFGQLYERYYSAMVALAYSVLVDRHLAEDAAQETFAKACYHLPRLKHKEKFAGWLAGICRNVARDTIRARRRLVFADPPPKVVVNPGTDETDEAVRDAIAKLSTSDREIIMLRYFSRMSYEQISTLLDISVQAINGRLTRAKRKIATYLERDGFPGDKP